MTRRRRKSDGYAAWAPEGSPTIAGDVSPARIPLSEVLRDPAPAPLEQPPLPGPATRPETERPEVARVSRASLPQRYRDLHERAITRLERELEGMEHGAFLSAFRTLEERLYGKAVQPLRVTEELNFDGWPASLLKVLVDLLDAACAGRLPDPALLDLLGVARSQAPALPTTLTEESMGGGFGSTLAALLDPDPREDV